MTESSKKDYKNGRIYCIRNHITNDIYVGSTTQALSKRMQKHRASMKLERDKNTWVYQKMNEIGAEIFYIELIEECPCENVEQLRKREGEVIRELKPALNQRIEGRTHEEYRKDNSDKIVKYVKKWRQDNPDKDKQYRKTHYEKHKEQIQQYRQDNKEILAIKKKEHYQQNKKQILETCKGYYDRKKEHILEKHKQVIECPCGVNFTHGHKSRHLKSKHHQNYEKSLLENND